MLSEPTIWVDCNFCTNSEEIPLTSCVKGVYDTANIQTTLLTWGWVQIEEDVHKCPFCIAEER